MKATPNFHLQSFARSKAIHRYVMHKIYMYYLITIVAETKNRALRYCNGNKRLKINSAANWTSHLAETRDRASSFPL